MKNLTLISLLIFLSFMFINSQIYPQKNWLDETWWQYRCEGVLLFAPDFDFNVYTSWIYPNDIEGWENSSDKLKLVSDLEVYGCNAYSIRKNRIEGLNGQGYYSLFTTSAWPPYIPNNSNCGSEGCAYEYFASDYTWTIDLILITGNGEVETLLDRKTFTGLIASSDNLYQDYNSPICQGIQFGDCYVNKPSYNNNSKTSKYSLEQNYPNPFNPITNINYSVSSDGLVLLKVYDALGNEVAVLVNENKPAGSYTVEFNSGQLASGIYMYKLTSGKLISIKKLILLK